MPVAIAPTGLNGIFWPHGDIVLARSAAKAGIPFILSTPSSDSIEEVARHSDGDRWFQLDVVQRGLAADLTQRAKDNGYSTLVLTTDVAVNGNRERDLRNKFGVPVQFTPRTIPDGMTHLRWSLSFIRNGIPQLANFATANATSVDAQAAVMSRQMDASFDWQALRELRDAWSGTLGAGGRQAGEAEKGLERKRRRRSALESRVRFGGRVPPLGFPGVGWFHPGARRGGPWCPANNPA